MSPQNTLDPSHPWGPSSPLHYYSQVPDDKAVRVDLGATATIEQDPRVPHDGTGGEVLILQWRSSGQQLIEVL